ncbi:universal stress protein [Methyloligella solikamskensis]|uniref:Universal stress protein n=1 Tax=Methyloligella solikamskensis TaxID=1177756 RepID=A0ABW3J7A8_9HYPH
MAETTQKAKPAAKRQTGRTAKTGQTAKPATAKKPASKKAAAKKPAAAKSASTSTPRPRKKREVFHEGHKRKLLVVVDETPECESALAYAASRAKRTDGKLALAYVIEPGDFQHWLGVEEIAREEGHNKARAVFRLFGRKLKAMGFEKIVPEEIIREGHKAEEITQLIEEDHDIGVLVLGASRDPSGPGPLVTSLVAGRAGTFQIPITVVPGCLNTEEILAMA